MKGYSRRLLKMSIGRYYRCVLKLNQQDDLFVMDSKRPRYCDELSISVGIWFLAFMVFVLLMPMGAQADSGPSGLSLDDAVDKALGYHPLLKAKESEVSAAESDLAAAKWGAYPQMSLSTQTVFNDENTRVFNVSQPIWAGGQISGNIDLASAVFSETEAGLSVEIKSIVLSTSQAFFEVLLSGEKLKIAENNMQEHSKLVKIIQRRFRAKTSPEVDVMLASARLAQAEAQVAQMEVAQEIAWTQLSQLIGFRPRSLVYPQAEAALSVLGDFALKDLKAMALDYSPDIKALSANVEKSRASVRVAKSIALPKINLGYEKRYGNLRFGQDQEQLFLGIDFQPGAGLSSRRQLSAAKLRVDSSRSNLQALSLETNQTVEILYQQHFSSKSQIETTRVLVEAMSEVVASYLRQYTVGRKTWLDVLNSQRELFQAKNSLVDFRSQNLNTGYKLLAESGILQSNYLVKGSSGDRKSND